MAASDDLRVDPAVMQGFGQALRGGASDLRARLAELDAQVSEVLGGWRGGAGSAYGSAWEMWHRGAAEVELGLSMLAGAVAQAGEGYQQSEAASGQALREVRGG
ncbi:WXG100 family type VII secretion target [Mycobacterium sp. 663a-19]|uniref:WXG100 family type VII secretion target n=1 Tax=Mycobacterium sp. 663a-19 TaxID=2986148 RepID=UPI002D1E63BE|nr:WXG100 family type VII secretion target [Mycobacterium sp. 663a-19]MEB3983657.1 WXG100 family type VII secretion target [Mycobacterium sp. 663a-19]